MKCIVFGGNGFIGQHLCEGLVRDGHDVRVFGRFNRDSAKRKNILVDWFEGDFLNGDDVGNALVGYDIVFHLISATLPKSSNEDPVYDVESNLLATIKLLQLAIKHKIKKVIFTSSGGTVYGVQDKEPLKESHPTSPICSYGITKLAIEKYLHLFQVLHGLDYVVLRISNLYGEGQRTSGPQGAIGVFIWHALLKEPIKIWGDGSVIRDYIHVRDVVSAGLKALNYTGENRVFNISSGVGKSLNDIIRVLEKELGRTVDCVNKECRNVDLPINILNNSLAQEELSWTPKIGFEAGIIGTLAHYKKEI